MEDVVITVKKIQSVQVPRAVRFRVLSLLNMNFLAMVMLIGMITLAFGSYIIITFASYFGREAGAVIVNAEEVKRAKGGDMYYRMSISFPVPDNTYNESVSVTENFYKKNKKGGIIRIRYTDVGHSYPYINEDDANMRSYMFFPLIPVVVILLVFAWFLKRGHDLLTNGAAVVGTVLEVMVSHGKNGKNYYWRTEYFWNREPFIKDFRGKKKNPGQVVVLLDPNNPKRAQIYGGKFNWRLADSKDTECVFDEYVE